MSSFILKQEEEADVLRTSCCEVFSISFILDLRFWELTSKKNSYPKGGVLNWDELTLT